jgi:hypothetical protein
MTLGHKSGFNFREAMACQSSEAHGTRSEDAVIHNAGSLDALSVKVACRGGAPMTWAHLAQLTRDQVRQAA